MKPTTDVQSIGQKRPPGRGPTHRTSPPPSAYPRILRAPSQSSQPLKMTPQRVTSQQILPQRLQPAQGKPQPNQSGQAQPPPPQPDQKRPELLDQVRNVLRTKHYSIRTDESCVQWIKRHILFHNKRDSRAPLKSRHPAEMGEKEISEFLTYLAVNEHVAASTQNQALSAILFL